MRIKIGDKEGCLEEDETGNPDCGRTAKGREKLLCSDGLG
jgi:hypothetical protein